MRPTSVFAIFCLVVGVVPSSALPAKELLTNPFSNAPHYFEIVGGRKIHHGPVNVPFYGKKPYPPPKDKPLPPLPLSKDKPLPPLPPSKVKPLPPLPAPERPPTAMHSRPNIIERIKGQAASWLNSARQAGMAFGRPRQYARVRPYHWKRQDRVLVDA
ncbi:hypothetical protein F5148DRAFT_324898 [Russula earlei]|uniref:Uncharacterized protein n=1 Tax=Russula earlei TaxID=71964 RepID=A0ACC0UIB4_9AGAM|nr:hypothetical protein F5148DRAFT_324898 [Russula earlei]